MAWAWLGGKMLKSFQGNFFGLSSFYLEIELLVCLDLRKLYGIKTKQNT